MSSQPESTDEQVPEQRVAREAEAVERQIAELTDRWRRAVAELDNQRKRHARELEQQRVAERIRAAAEWLPVVDNLERALAQANADREAMLAGVRATRDQAIDILDRLGFPRDDEKGVPFDPARHEVVDVVDEPSVEPGHVAEVVLPGYGVPTRQLRPASVVVSGRRE